MENPNQDQINQLTDKVQILTDTKKAYLEQKGKAIKGITIRTNTESVTLNTFLENPIYTDTVSTFIDALVVKIEEEITMINDYIKTLEPLI